MSPLREMSQAQPVAGFYGKPAGKQPLQLLAATGAA